MCDDASSLFTVPEGSKPIVLDATVWIVGDLARIKVDVQAIGHLRGVCRT